MSMKPGSIKKFLKQQLPLKDQNATGTSSVREESAFNNMQEPVSTATVKEFVDLRTLPSDPADKKRISEYHPNQLDEIRRAYLIKGQCQPYNHDFPRKKFGKDSRRFNPSWFNQYGNWLEYSKKEDKVYCLFCYLFRGHFGNQGGSGAFVTDGFCAWNKKERLDSHVGSVNSAHNLSLKRCEDLMKQEQSIVVTFHRQTDIEENEYRIRLYASIDACRYLLHQGLPFRGHDESDDSLNRGNFVELVKYTSDQNESVRSVVLTNALKNHQMVAPSIQKDIANCFAREIVQNILAEFKDDYFSLLVDESSDVSGKEQMAVVLRFVDSSGNVKERFIYVVHMIETSALCLKSVIDDLFADLSLSLTSIRGQGYDGASNMKGQFNGLKALIMKENVYAYYVYCFSYQLQLALVAVAKNDVVIADFFNMISLLINVVGASCKRKEMIRKHQAQTEADGINGCLIETGKGLNQELALKRAGDTHWGSYYRSLLNLIGLFSTVIKVFEDVKSSVSDPSKQAQARGLLIYFQTFDFIFNLQLMKTILEITNQLSVALQKKDEDIVNAMLLVEATKKRLQDERDNGWELLLGEITSFCQEHNIDCLGMNDAYVDPCNTRRKTNITNEFHYRVECFYAVLDKQLLELNDRFNEVNSELLLCVATLNPRDNFDGFDTEKLVRLAQFYPHDFSLVESMSLENELKTYIVDVRSDKRFSNLKGLGDLSKVFVQKILVLYVGASTDKVYNAFACSNRKCRKMLLSNENCQDGFTKPNT